MATFRIFRETVLPSTLTPSAVYYIAPAIDILPSPNQRLW